MHSLLTSLLNGFISGFIAGAITAFILRREMKKRSRETEQFFSYINNDEE